MPPPALVPSEEVPPNALDIANVQPTCSSSSSGITCTPDVEFDPDIDDDGASSDKDMYASDPTWTDSEHSSYLNFMEENFVRDLYEREYCALDVCGQRSHHQHVEETHDPDTAESCFPTPFGFKVWENGNWTRRPNAKRKVHPRTVLSNDPWVKHFRRRVSCGSDMSNTTLSGKMQDEPQTLFNHRFANPNGNAGSRGVEVSSSSVCRGDSELEAKHCVQQPSIHGIS